MKTLHRVATYPAQKGEWGLRLWRFPECYQLELSLRDERIPHWVGLRVLSRCPWEWLALVHYHFARWMYSWHPTIQRDIASGATE